MHCLAVLDDLIDAAGEVPRDFEAELSARSLIAWTAGAHVPAVKPSSLPHERHYMHDNDTARIGVTPTPGLWVPDTLGTS